MRAEATFVNKEEVPLVPIYRDPIHDFGFFRSVGVEGNKGAEGTWG